MNIPSLSTAAALLGLSLSLISSPLAWAEFPPYMEQGQLPQDAGYYSGFAPSPAQGFVQYPMPYPNQMPHPAYDTAPRAWSGSGEFVHAVPPGAQSGPLQTGQDTGYPSATENGSDVMSLIHQNSALIQQLYGRLEQFQYEQLRQGQALIDSQQLLHHAQAALQRVYAEHRSASLSADMAPGASELIQTVEEGTSSESSATEQQWQELHDQLASSEKTNLALQQQLEEGSSSESSTTEQQWQKLHDQLASSEKTNLALQQQLNEMEEALVESQRQQEENLTLLLEQKAQLSEQASELNVNNEKREALENQLALADENQKRVQVENDISRQNLLHGGMELEACNAQWTSLNEQFVVLRDVLEQERSQHKKVSANGEQWQKSLQECASDLARVTAALELSSKQSRVTSDVQQELPATVTVPVIQASVASQVVAPIATTHKIATLVDTEKLQTDTDGDRLSDSMDLCPDQQGSWDSLGCPVEVPLVLEVQFGHDSNELAETARTSLMQVAAVLRQNEKSRHEVAGHTDNVGDPAYNAWLSQQRAKSVRDFLVEQGVSADRLTVQGYGGNEPIEENNSIQGRRVNRRVELRWLE